MTKAKEGGLAGLASRYPFQYEIQPVGAAWGIYCKLPPLGWSQLKVFYTLDEANEFIQIKRDQA